MLAVSVAAIGRAEMQTRMSARLEATNVASETHILLKLLTQHSTLRQLVTRLGRLPANSLCFTLALHIRGRRLASLNLSRSRCRSDGERRCRCFKGRDGLSARRVSELVCILYSGISAAVVSLWRETYRGGQELIVDLLGLGIISRSITLQSGDHSICDKPKESPILTT
jgi:hypothetical protein